MLLPPELCPFSVWTEIDGRCRRPSSSQQGNKRARFIQLRVCVTLFWYTTTKEPSRKETANLEASGAKSAVNTWLTAVRRVPHGVVPTSIDDGANWRFELSKMDRFGIGSDGDAVTSIMCQGP